MSCLRHEEKVLLRDRGFRCQAVMSRYFIDVAELSHET